MEWYSATYNQIYSRKSCRKQNTKCKVNHPYLACKVNLGWFKWTTAFVLHSLHGLLNKVLGFINLI